MNQLGFLDQSRPTDDGHDEMQSVRLGISHRFTRFTKGQRMKTITLKLTWQTRTANLEGELRGNVLNDRHKEALIRDLSVRGFRAEEVPSAVEESHD